jgi:hypothetical protein
LSTYSPQNYLSAIVYFDKRADQAMIADQRDRLTGLLHQPVAIP